MKDGKTLAFTKKISTSDPNGEAKAIQSIIEEQGINPYNLSFVLDGDNETYKAEYLHSLNDFQTRQSLLNMETNIRTVENNTAFFSKRLALRTMLEDQWIDLHASGTLRKNKRIGFSYRLQYLAERVAYEFGYAFEILPRSKITFGDAITEEDCHALTEAGWHIERYIETNIFGDFVQAKYIHIEDRDGSKREGVGIIVRETSCPWIPTGHIVFALVAEFDPCRKDWKDAVNPF